MQAITPSLVNLGLVSSSDLFDTCLELETRTPINLPNFLSSRVHWQPGTGHVPSCIGDLPNFDFAVDPNTLTHIVVAEFERCPDLPGALLVQAGRYVGLISRHRCLQHLSRPFGLEVFLKRPILHLYSALGANPQSLPATLAIDQAVDFALKRAAHDLYEPIAIELPGQVMRVLDLHTLLLAQSQLLASATRTIQRQSAIGRALSSTLSLAEVLELILTHVSEMVPYDRAGILLLRNNQLQLAASRGFPVEVDVDRLLADFQASSLYQQVSATRSTFTLNGAAQVFDWPTQLRLEASSAWLGVPIVQADNWLGMMTLARLTPTLFTSEEVEQVENLTAQSAALALQNALRYENSTDTNELLEQRVQERTQELIKANQVKDQFVANVSHEFRTPLANIQLYLRLLDDGKPEKRPQYLETLRREAMRLHRLIEGLLDLHDLDTNHQGLQLVPLDLNRLLRNLVTDWQVAASERGLQLATGYDYLLPLASAEPTLVTQVINNLLSNAFNYTPAGGIIRLHTSVKVQAERSWIVMEIHDTGPGISEKDLPHIFERFYRGEAARLFRSPGTGLGLSICQTIIERLGGRLTVDTQPDLGSTFAVWLQPRFPYNPR
jgi:signal transduction histidine kinase